MSGAMGIERARDRLIELVRERGYFRTADLDQRKRKKQNYKKGWETRFVADSKAEIRSIERIIRAAGFEPGGPFQKHNQFIVPLYGKAATQLLQHGIAEKLRN